MYNGLNALTRRTFGVIAVGLALAANNASAADFLFGLSGVNDVNSLSLDGGSITLFSDVNQGSWSGTGSSSGPNYLVGITDDGHTDFRLNNFFIFDISGLTTPVTSAVLNLRFYTPYSATAADKLTYWLFDVSTNLVDLDKHTGKNPAIFDDLGSGTSYGSFLISIDPANPDYPADDKLELKLNSAALVDLNKAIANGAPKFAIGGTLSPVPDSGSTLVLFGLAAAGIWSLRKRKQAA